MILLLGEKFANIPLNAQRSTLKRGKPFGRDGHKEGTRASPCQKSST